MANNWAIIVGINDYDFLPDAPLRFAVKDARAMRIFLCRKAGFPKSQVLMCGDGTLGTRKATRPVLRDILLHQIQRAKNADNLCFFFSGHGLDEHLMMVDANPKDLSDTAISINFVTDHLRACQATNIVMVLDMCRNESHDVEQKSATFMGDLLKGLVQDREGQQGIITLFSCGRGQSSYEIASLKRGAFTYALLEGLGKTGILKNLETYLAKRLPELHLEAGKATRKQVPLVIPEPGRRYEEPILTHYATAMDVTRLKEMAVDAEADGEIERATQLWEQVIFLAKNAGDRQQALNWLRGLMERSKPLEKKITPLSLEELQQVTQHEPQPQNQIDTIPLESEKGIDYSKLREMLKAGKWEESDQETWEVILKMTGKELEDWLSGA